MTKIKQLKRRPLAGNTWKAIQHACTRQLAFTAFTITAMLLLSASNVYAQAGKLPPFRMVQTDGKTFKAESLPVGKPILIIYFSPECDHCQKLMDEFFKRANDFKKASVVMITFLSIETVKKFSADYKISKYPNIYVGTEGVSFYLKNYYNLANMPFTALYDKNGNLVSTYREVVSLNDITRKLAIL